MQKNLYKNFILEVRELIESRALDDLEEFNKMNKKEQEHIIDYWVENYDKE